MVTWKLSDVEANRVLIALRARQSRLHANNTCEASEYGRLVDDLERSRKQAGKGEFAPLECFSDANQLDNIWEGTVRIGERIRHFPLTAKSDKSFQAELLAMEHLADELEGAVLTERVSHRCPIVIYSDCQTLVSQLNGRGRPRNALGDRVLNLRYRLEEIALHNDSVLLVEWMKRNLLNKRLRLPN